MEKVFLLILLCTFTYTCWTQATETQATAPDGWYDGSGGEIKTLANIKWLAETKEDWDKDRVQTADIDASEPKYRNTNSVGTGTAYNVNSELIAAGDTIVLYAQWKQVATWVKTKSGISINKIIKNDSQEDKYLTSHFQN